jgi:hypothetical protein
MKLKYIIDEIEKEVSISKLSDRHVDKILYQFKGEKTKLKILALLIILKLR